MTQPRAPYITHNGSGQDTRQRVYRAIIAYKRSHDGNSPSYRELMALTDITSAGHLDYALRALADEDLIRIGGTRQIEIIGAVWTAPE